MKHVLAKKSYVLLHDDGVIHYPFTRYLTDCFSNIHTRELVAQALRILYRFFIANKIELLDRATEGRALTYSETRSLVDICYRPIGEIESITDKKLVFLSSAKSNKSPSELPNAVESNTARKRLNNIAGYLSFYFEVFLEPNFRSDTLREQLRQEYQKTGRQLRNAVRGTKQNHHLAIKSLPTEKYLKIIEAVVTRPKSLYQSLGGKTSRTMLRDRAMTLLSCEGLRPGALGNIVLSDFRENSGHLVIKDNRSRRIERISSGTPKLKMGDSTKVNHASETMISLWPFTISAIQDYIDTERSAILMKGLTNKSSGFLFINQTGKPIKHRSTITEMFSKLGTRLALLGLLDVDDDPFFYDQPKYDFYSYVLRHSAASFFLTQKSMELAHQRGASKPSQYMDIPDRIKDLMKLRFGWTINSNMPELYAARAMSDHAQIVLAEFNESINEELETLREKREDRRRGS